MSLKETGKSLMGMEEWSKALKLLRDGDYSAWPKHHHIRTGRPEAKGFFESTPNFGLPVWEGEKVESLLVNADCGMGDTICFYRWIPLIDPDIEVTLRCDREFGMLLPTYIIDKCEELIGFPARSAIHMLAVPEVLGITEVTGEPYLKPRGRDMVAGLSETKFTKIGVCWAGNPFNPRDAERSIPVEFFNFFGDLKPFALVKHEAAPDFMLDCRNIMITWNSTAHLLSHMDLIISVDTAIAHLAGAMGKPVWMLLPEKADWRWGDEGITTPWYDSMRIFRRKTTWEDLLEEVKEDITTLFG